MKVALGLMFAGLLGLAALPTQAQIRPEQTPEDFEAKVYARAEHLSLQEAKRRLAILAESDPRTWWSNSARNIKTA